MTNYVTDYWFTKLCLNIVLNSTLQLVFEDLLERVKEKEEKEAKKRQRLAEDFSDKLRTIKVSYCYETPDLIFSTEINIILPQHLSLLPNTGFGLYLSLADSCFGLSCRI